MSKRRNRHQFQPEFQTDTKQTQTQTVSKKLNEAMNPPENFAKTFEKGDMDQKNSPLFKRIDMMEANYLEKKLGIAKSDEIFKKIEIKKNDKTDDDRTHQLKKNDESSVPVFENMKKKPKYNDYPFEDEPYKSIEEETTNEYNDFPEETQELPPGVTDESVPENMQEDEYTDGKNEQKLDELYDISDYFDSKKNRRFIIENDNDEPTEPKEETAPENTEMPDENGNNITYYYEDEESDANAPDMQDNCTIDPINESQNEEAQDRPAPQYMNSPPIIPQRTPAAPAPIQTTLPPTTRKKPFNVERAVEYAHRWALDRNPEFYDYEEIGGDCTNYISQILLAGGCEMDKTPIVGWYYTNANNKSPSWTGVEQLYNYLCNKNFPATGRKIVAYEIPMSEARAGDIVQLSFNAKNFQHTPFIVRVENEDIFVCAHTYDSDNRRLSSYQYKKVRFIRIESV